MSGYIEGFTSDAQFCPFCGEPLSERWADGKHECPECKKTFFVVEDEHS